MMLLKILPSLSHKYLVSQHLEIDIFQNSLWQRCALEFCIPSRLEECINII